MGNRCLSFLVVAVGLAALSLAPVAGQTSGAAARTPWGAPDLQGIWQDEQFTPFERPKEFGAREFLTEQERAAQAEARAKEVAKYESSVEVNAGDKEFRNPAKERDVAGAYNTVWVGVPASKIGRRTSVVIDPPDGRVPPLTPEAAKRVAAYREFQLALLQATDTCKRKITACKDGQYAPPSPRRAELPPVYNIDRLNRADGPEDRSTMERCFGSQIPLIGLGGFPPFQLQRIVQSPDAVAIFYDWGQGWGFSRVIPISNRPHLPSTVREQYGDARGRWEGDTLVVDVVNFTNKTDFRGSRENLHLIERFRRIDANTLEYKVTLDDPTTWTKPWTAISELGKQDDKANQIYQQTCHEGNYGLTGMLANMRAAEKLFREGKGPDPATEDTATGGGND